MSSPERPVPEPGKTVRRKDDGTFELLIRDGLSLRRGYWQEWAPVGTHLARYMAPMPIELHTRLTALGYDGGLSLYELLISEGWTPPGGAYLEQAPTTVEGHRLIESRPALPEGVEHFDDVERDEDGNPDLERDFTT